MHREPDAIVRFRLESSTIEGGPKTVFSGYRPIYDIRSDYWTSTHHEFTSQSEVTTGQEATAKVWFLTPEAYPKSLWIGRVLRVAEGSRQVGTATIEAVLNPILHGDEA
jgi:translation elongation factor EF-Tu-like GTPase